MKGDKKAKTKSKLVNESGQEDKQNENALKNRLLCFSSVDGTRRLIQIVDSRLKESEKDKPLTEYSYEYYISFLKLNRRFDCWINREDVELVFA